jgi:uncharacterized protein
MRMIKTARILLLLPMMALPLGSPSADELSDGIEAYNAGEYSEAQKIFTRLAEQGHAPAHYNLGFMYANGLGVPENDAEAVKLYRLAAQQGEAQAQSNLGVMYANGEGVIQNNVIAHTLFNLAGAQGLEEGRKKRDIIAERMPSADISKAQEMARTCLENNYKGCGF